MGPGREQVIHAQTPREGGPETWPEARSHVGPRGQGCPVPGLAPQGSMATAAWSPDSSREVVCLGCDESSQFSNATKSAGGGGEGGTPVAAMGQIWLQFPSRDKESGMEAEDSLRLGELGSLCLCPCSSLRHLDKPTSLVGRGVSSLRSGGRGSAWC